MGCIESRKSLLAVTGPQNCYRQEGRVLFVCEGDGRETSSGGMFALLTVMKKEVSGLVTELRMSGREGGERREAECECVWVCRSCNGESGVECWCP